MIWPWNLNSLSSPLHAQPSWSTESYQHLHSGSCYLDTFLILLLFWPKCYLPPLLRIKFHVLTWSQCSTYTPDLFSWIKECSVYSHLCTSSIQFNINFLNKFIVLLLIHTIFKVLVFSFLIQLYTHKILKEMCSFINSLKIITINPVLDTVYRNSTRNDTVI